MELTQKQIEDLLHVFKLVNKRLWLLRFRFYTGLCTIVRDLLSEEKITLEQLKLFHQYLEFKTSVEKNTSFVRHLWRKYKYRPRKDWVMSEIKNLTKNDTKKK